ncbi:Translational activator GCN1 [Monoraphidium neglectum]|uniref:Translational activator GCN1 n=1 Tax=Monoraphidium neglectum TaxID=145388 RepID=A0A0D2LIZ2_9CHLO|nr:Translational activator GCN1 [Monoraphidium neglectum]KIY91964.1 Translational activator GCN1 [Monoraphidium neglectum]|eukprot:XP_013890984.1 Translational activator GCN1 [Monoraphidium neglectum]
MLASAKARNAFVREGHLTLFRYLPLTMEAAFMTHLGEVLPAILDGLSDESEGVRDAALAAARAFVEIYAKSCLPLLLPAVEAGLSHEAWRIRQASVELCGELLFKVAGTTGRVKVDGGSDDEGAASEAHGQAILQALGRQRRDEPKPWPPTPTP